MNYYEHHIGDHLKKTVHLNALEEGIYRRLLDRYYTTELPLPADLRECCKLARATTKSERDAVRDVLKDFFLLCDGGHHQKRADEEIARFKDKQAKAKRSANARWDAQRLQSEGNANVSDQEMRSHMRTQSERNAPRARPQTPVTNNHTVIPPLPPTGGISSAPEFSLESCDGHGEPLERTRAGDGYSVAFEAAWIAYPERPGHSKSKAWAAWKARIKAGGTEASMLDGVKRYAAYSATCHTEPQFIKHASTFFGPDMHYLNDWTPPASSRASTPGTQLDPHRGFDQRNYEEAPNGQFPG